MSLIPINKFAGQNISKKYFYLLFNKQSNINFNGAFRIKPAEIKAQAEITTLFTQGMKKFTNIFEKGDMVVVVRDNYDKRVGNYLSENSVKGVEYFPKINTKCGLDDEKPEGLLLTWYFNLIY